MTAHIQIKQINDTQLSLSSAEEIKDGHLAQTLLPVYEPLAKLSL